MEMGAQASFTARIVFDAEQEADFRDVLENKRTGETTLTPEGLLFTWIAEFSKKQVTSYRQIKYRGSVVLGQQSIGASAVTITVTPEDLVRFPDGDMADPIEGEHGYLVPIGDVTLPHLRMAASVIAAYRVKANQAVPWTTLQGFCQWGVLDKLIDEISALVSREIDDELTESKKPAVAE